MHTYHIFYAITSCDADWQPLEKIESATQEDALREAARRWPQYSRGDLIAVPQEEQKELSVSV